MSTQRFRTAVLALAALLAITSCGRIETVLAFGATVNGVDRSVVLDPPKEAAKASCAGKLTNDNRLAPPPGLPAVPDASWLLGRAVPGKRVYVGWVVAREPRLALLRTEFIDEAERRGYDVVAGQWQGRVLHLAYSGPAEVDVTLQPYCREALAVRYVVGKLEDPAPFLPSPAVASRRTCPPLSVDAQPSTEDQLPLAYPPGAQTLRIGAVGNADAYTALVPGSPDTVGAVRDGLLAGLSASGYVAAPLPVAGGLAETLLAGPRTGDVLVQPWCRGVLALRYELVPAQDIETPAASAARPCTGRTEPEPLSQNLPSDLTRPGQSVLSLRRSLSFRAWTTVTQVPGGAAVVLAGDVAKQLQAQGGQLQPLTAPDGMRAANLRIGGSSVLLLVRPQCLNHVAEQYVVVP